MSENEKLEQTKPAKSDKKKDAKADKKPGFFARIGKWFKELKSELKKVQWPTKKQTINNTVIVILCCIVVGICIWVFDALTGSVIRAQIGRASCRERV